MRLGAAVGHLRGHDIEAVRRISRTVAFVPLGIPRLRVAPRPSRRSILRTVPVVVLFVMASIVTTQPTVIAARAMPRPRCPLRLICPEARWPRTAPTGASTKVAAPSASMGLSADAFRLTP
jgi:hypothetical protein